MFFNPDDVPEDEFKALPDGKYHLMVIDSDGKDTKAGTGRYMEVAFQVITGEFKGRRLRDRFNVQNQNEEAARIGKQQMKKFLLAIGSSKPLASEMDFHHAVKNKTVYADVVIDEKDDRYNKIKGYLFQKGDAPTASKPKAGLAKAADDLF